MRLLQILLIVIILTAIGGYFLFQTTQQNTVPTPQITESITTLPKETIPTETATGEVKEFSITARQWSFEPSSVTVKQGDRVKLTIISVDVTHGFTLREFGINTVLSAGKTIDVEFVADKKGTFTFFCSVYCGAGHSGMNGKLVVE